MKEHIAFIIHHPQSRSNRVADLLTARGYAVDWYCPREGDPLPPDPQALAGAVLLGGAMSANDDSQEAYLRVEYRWIEQMLKAQRPFLGICLGAQMLARVLGGTVAPHPQDLTEVGYYPITSTAAGRDIFGDNFHAFHWHREGIRLPADTELLATGEIYPVQAFRHSTNTYGLQFHPEVTRTIFQRWLVEASHCCDWLGTQTPDQMIADWRRHDRAIEIQTDRLLEIWLNHNSGEYSSAGAEAASISAGRRNSPLSVAPTH